jgi:hypothetical protein
LAQPFNMTTDTAAKDRSAVGKSCKLPLVTTLAAVCYGSISEFESWEAQTAASIEDLGRCLKEAAGNSNAKAPVSPSHGQLAWLTGAAKPWRPFERLVFRPLGIRGRHGAGNFRWKRVMPKGGAQGLMGLYRTLVNPVRGGAVPRIHPVARRTKDDPKDVLMAEGREWHRAGLVDRTAKPAA